jgi:hypothetical protein
VYEERVLKRIFEPKREEISEEHHPNVVRGASLAG